jgi:teichoic acid transport system permease protein
VTRTSTPPAPARPVPDAGGGRPDRRHRTGRAVRREVVDGAHLGPVSGRPPLAAYLAQLWGRRHFILCDARARVRSGTSGTLLGRVWLVLRPVLDATVYLVVFGLVLRSSRGIENFLGYLVVGTFMFQYTVRCLNGGAMALLRRQALLRAFAFPRAALPLAAVVRETLSYLLVLVAMVVLVVLLPPGPVLSWRWLLVLPALGLQVLLCAGLALVACRATTRVPDLQHVIAFLARLWFYASAVFFSYERFLDHPQVLAVIDLNPMYRLLEITRDCLLYGRTPPGAAWLVLGGWSVGLVAVGLLWSWRGEDCCGGG